MRFRFSDLVGTYRLVVTDDLITFIEHAFVAPRPVAERDAARAEALQEAAGAEFEVTADGHAISRAHGQEFYRVRLEIDDREYEELSFEKAPGVTVKLVMASPTTLLAHQSGKPLARFQRV